MTEAKYNEDDPHHGEFPTTFSPMAGPTTSRPSFGGGATNNHSHRAVLSNVGNSATTTATATGGAGGGGSMTLRARRRREEAVRRLVADVQAPLVAVAPPTDPLSTLQGNNNTKGSTDPLVSLNTATTVATAATTTRDAETHQWLVASTVAAALEKGLDRELHAELVQEAKDNAGRIGQICHDHADVFLSSVAKVAALGEPCSELNENCHDAFPELQNKTILPMQISALQWEQACVSYAKARTLQVLVQACQSVAQQLDRARKQASLGRPRAALDAVEVARQALATPMETLFVQANIDPGLFHVVHMMSTTTTSPSGAVNNLSAGAATATGGGITTSTSPSSTTAPTSTTSSTTISLEQTPFGKRATLLLPKIENEVLMNAKRGFNRWMLQWRNSSSGASTSSATAASGGGGGDQVKMGRAVLRHVSRSVSMGTGQLGLGGHLPPAYVWRAKTADNLVSRLHQGGKVARAVRLGYWFDRDAIKESDKLDQSTKPGLERRAETIATAFGWYRCWEEIASLLVDPADFQAFDGDNSMRSNLSGSRHGLSGSRHGLGGSRHGLKGSRHGRRSLGFRATTSSRSQAFQDITSTLGTSASIKAANQGSKWAELLIPSILLDGGNSKEDDDKLLGLSESVHPVRRAELAFYLLGRSDEFVQYYESNRFGEVTITSGAEGSGGTASGSNKDDGKSEKRSPLSSLTGDDVTLGTDRIFFAKTLNHLVGSVVGFCAVEAALELGNFVDDDGGDDDKARKISFHANAAGGGGTVSTLSSATRFRESSERYERSLISELGYMVRGRASRASQAELVRASALMAAFRSSLKIVHPSSSTRRHDNDLLALDVDILLTARKVAQSEQSQATAAIVADDPKIPMLVSESPSLYSRSSASSAANRNKSPAGVPDPEEIGLPFGLHNLKQIPQKVDLDFQEQSRTSYNRAAPDEAFTFSQCVPEVLRTLHSRAIAIAAFALSQEELGQKFPPKKGSAAAVFVLECVEDFVSVAASAMKDSDNVVEEGSVEKAVQVMANISALQHCLPRFFGTLMRGMCHIGLIRSEELEDTFAYCEKTLKGADRSCDSQVGSTYSLVYEICRNKIDSHINYALENFNWVAKSTRDMPNAYCEGLIGYLRSVFASLGPMDEGSRAGLHFSCLGHVSERLVKLLSGKPGDTALMDDGGIPPISRIDAFGIKNLALDTEEFERFADSMGIPQLRDCFSELKVLTTVMLDKELPVLLLPENAPARRRKYPILSMEKVGNILEKYVGTGLGDKLMGGGASRKTDFLFIDKKEVQQLLRIVRSQGY